MGSFGTPYGYCDDDWVLHFLLMLVAACRLCFVTFILALFCFPLPPSSQYIFYLLVFFCFYFFCVIYSVVLACVRPRVPQG